MMDKVSRNVAPAGNSNPKMSGLFKSSCNCLPSTGGKCELLSHSKKNPICENCSVRMGRGYVNSTSEERANMVIELNGRESLYSSGAYVARTKDNTCSFIGCDEPCYNKYCTYHARIVGARKGLYSRGNMKWTPETWDTVPVRAKK